MSTLLGIYYLFFKLIKSSAAVAYSLRGLTHCVFRDALLHTTAVMCGYLYDCHLPVSFEQSGPSSGLTSLISNTFLPSKPLLCKNFRNFMEIVRKIDGNCPSVHGKQPSAQGIVLHLWKQPSVYGNGSQFMENGLQFKENIHIFILKSLCQ